MPKMLAARASRIPRMRAADLLRHSADEAGELGKVTLEGGGRFCPVGCGWDAEHLIVFEMVEESALGDA
jgi:hypothetical protein